MCNEGVQVEDAAHEAKVQEREDTTDDPDQHPAAQHESQAEKVKSKMALIVSHLTSAGSTIEPHDSTVDTEELCPEAIEALSAGQEEYPLQGLNPMANDQAYQHIVSSMIPYCSDRAPLDLFATYARLKEIDPKWKHFVEFQRRAHEDGALKYRPTDYVCDQCVPFSGDECKLHGRDYLVYKCRYCCSEATWFCFGHVHFCDPCHNNHQILGRLPVHELAQCPAKPGEDGGLPLYTPPPSSNQIDQEAEPHSPPEVCPWLGIKHSPSGHEQVLGCGLCKKRA